MAADAGSGERTPRIAVVGHLCLDVIPELPHQLTLTPGSLNEVGPARFAPGGGVGNVGMALERLGIPVALMARIGRDVFGDTLRGLLAQVSPAAVATLQRASEGTSYTLVINPPGSDRLFLHHPGCNDAFTAADIDLERAAAMPLFYFGYPPLLRGVYADGGAALAGTLAALRARGVTTVMDLSLPDPNGPSGQVDWRAFLARVLPQVDLVTPSLTEVQAMLTDRPAAGEGFRPGPAVLEAADRLLDLGVGAVVLTLGEDGLLLRAGPAERLRGSLLEDWAGRTLWAPAFRVEVGGTTGAGDAATAGLLAALLGARSPAEALVLAAAVAAFSVEAPDATSGIRSLQEVEARLRSPWARLSAPPEGWRPHPSGAFLAPDELARPEGRMRKDA